MPLEAITRRSFAQSDRAEVQDRVAQQVERDPERFLALYVADPRSFGGRSWNQKAIMSTSNNTLPPSSNVNIEKVDSAKKPTTKQSEELREKSLEAWRKRMFAPLKDNEQLPRVW